MEFPAIWNIFWLVPNGMDFHTKRFSPYMEWISDMWNAFSNFLTCFHYISVLCLIWKPQELIKNLAEWSRSHISSEQAKGNGMASPPTREL